MKVRRALAVLALVVGCGPSGGVDPPEASASGTTHGGAGSSSSASGSSSGAEDGSTTLPLDPTGYEDDGATGCSFTCPDPPMPPPPGVGGWIECELVAQNCPDGEKCMPWDNTGGAEWNATRCSPIVDDPGQPGEPCTVEGSATSGIDSCALGSVCWQVEPNTHQGVCHSLCDAVHGCERGLDCAALAFDVSLCVEPCDPLASSCPPFQTCTFSGPVMTCQPAPLDGATRGEMCHPTSLPCIDGTLCSFDPAMTCLHLAGTGCCAEPCDIDDPGTCPAPEICIPWFPVAPPPELEHLGACAP